MPNSSALARSYGVTIPFGGNNPLAVSGGVWPDNTTFNLTQWPCVEALEGFLLGPEFVNDIASARGCGRLQSDELPASDPVTWVPPAAKTLPSRHYLQLSR